MRDARNLALGLIVSFNVQGSSDAGCGLSPDEMFELVADIESYPEFLPWCAGARVRGREQQGEKEIVTADLICCRFLCATPGKIYKPRDP